MCKASSKLIKKKENQQKAQPALVNELCLKDFSFHPHISPEVDNLDYCIYCYIFVTIALFI